MLAEFGEEGLNRYSFVGTPSRPSWAWVEAFLPGGLRQTCVVAWRQPVGFGAAQARLNASIVRRAGWELHTHGPFAAGAGPLAGADGVTSRLREPSGSFVLLGEARWSELARAEEAAGLVEDLPRRSRITPSREFLRLLAREGIGVAYLDYGGNDAYGLVVVTPLSLGEHLEQLQARSLLGEVLRGERAPDVWRRPDLRSARVGRGYRESASAGAGPREHVAFGGERVAASAAATSPAGARIRLPCARRRRTRAVRRSR